MSHPSNGYTQGLPKKSGYYLFQRKPGCPVGEVVVKVLLPGDNRRELVRFMDTWSRGALPPPDKQSEIENNLSEFGLNDPFITNGWYRPIDVVSARPDYETGIREAVTLLENGDDDAAFLLLLKLLPENEATEAVEIVRKAGGA